MAKFKEGDRVRVLPGDGSTFAPYLDSVGKVATVTDFIDKSGCGVTFEDETTEYICWACLGPATEDDKATELLRRIAADIQAYLSTKDKQG